MSSSKDRKKWNNRYAEATAAQVSAVARAETVSAGEPSPWALQHRSLLEHTMEGGRKPAGALDVASGLGRHSIWLAELGFDVDALDISDVAVEWMRRHAEATGLSITARRCDLATVDLEASRYRAVLVFNYLERALCPELARCLAPGGALIYETFLATPRRMNSRGPRNPKFLLRPGELPRLFPSLQIVEYREEEVGSSQVARLAAVAPRLPESSTSPS